jgi:hypothetical protein
MSWFSMWLFLWDDVIEDTAIPSSSPSQSQPQPKITTLHDRALAYVEYHLGLSPLTEEPKTPTKYCTLFKHAGIELQQDCTVRERREFYVEVERYMRAVEVESEWVGRKELPGVEEYWAHRMGTSSVYCYCALGE